MKILGVKKMINKLSPKVIQINDIVQWYQNGELQLSPKYQRNSVWNVKAKSYLIDTIIRGLPIPPIFVRQKIDLNTRKTFREIIDGQQRLRAITEFIDNVYEISKSHNSEFGGKKFEEFSDEEKEQFLEYEIVAEIINEKDDDIIYDMFARLNTNNYVLNKQELRNSKYWGEFKVAAYNLSAENREIFSENDIFSDKQFSRMDDVELISMLLNLTLNGISTDTPTSLDKLYEQYDRNFPELEEVEEKFQATMNTIKKIYNYFNGNAKCFTSKVYFYTLYATTFHQLFGLNKNDMIRDNRFCIENIDSNFNIFIEKLIQFDNDFELCVMREQNNLTMYETMEQFAKLHRTRTTNKNEREKRINILNNYIVGS